MSDRYDTIVIGAGHNGLATAGFLARAGRKVVVVEQRETLGGLAASEEFHPGYRSAGLLHDTTGVRAEVVRALELERHGLRLRQAPPATLALGAPGEALLLPGDTAGAAAAIAAHSPRDSESYARYTEFLARAREALAPFLNESPVDLLDPESDGTWGLLRHGLRLRRFGRRDLLEFLRLPPLAVADWLDEWFETDLLKATLALPALAGSFVGPRSPGTNANLLLHAAAAGPGVEGGGPALVEVLAGAARTHGAEIRAGAQVSGVLVAEAVRGVRLEDGEELQAPLVAASCHPQELFLRLLPRRALPFRLAHRIETYRSRGTTAQVLFALGRLPRFAGHAGGPIEFANTGRSLDEMERAFDAIKYRRLPERPILDIHLPSPSRSDLCPPGHAVLSVLVHFVPHDPEAGWSPGDRERLGDRVQEVLEPHCSDLNVIGRRVLVPPDLEAKYALPGGNILHGEHSLDQLLVRPAPQCSRYRTPIPGLWLCGSGSHPGGGLTCMPGALAARAILAS